MHYKYYVKRHGNQFYFGLYPGNNNRQPLAVSKDYQTGNDAKEGIEMLKKLLSHDKSAFTSFEEEKGFYFNLKENETELVFRRTKAIQDKYQVPKCINRIYHNSNAPLEVPKEKDSVDI